MSDETNTQTPPEVPSKPDAADELRKIGRVFDRIGKALKPLDTADRLRVIKAVAAIYGIDGYESLRAPGERK